MIGPLTAASVGLAIAVWRVTRRGRPADVDHAPALTALGLEEVRSGSSAIPGATRRVWYGTLHDVPVRVVPTADGRVVITLGNGPGADARPLLLRPRRAEDVTLDWRQRWLVDDDVAARLDAAGEADALEALHPSDTALPAWSVRDGVVGTIEPVAHVDADQLCRLAHLERLLTRSPTVTATGDAWWLSLLNAKGAPTPVAEVALREVAARAVRSPACAAAWCAAIEGPHPEVAVRAALAVAPAPAADALHRLADAVVAGRQVAPPSLAAALFRVATPDDAPRLVAALSPDVAPPDGLLDLLVRIGDATTAARLPALAAGWPSAHRARAAQVVASLVAVHGVPDGGGLTLPNHAGELTLASVSGELTMAERAR